MVILVVMLVVILGSFSVTPIEDRGLGLSGDLPEVASGVHFR